MGYFNVGFTTAEVNSYGKIPEMRDIFTIRVIIKALISILRGNRLDGRGSDKHVDFRDDKISCLISSTDAG